MYRCSRCGWTFSQSTRVEGWWLCPVCCHEAPASYSYVYQLYSIENSSSLTSCFDWITMAVSAITSVGAIMTLLKRDPKRGKRKARRVINNTIDVLSRLNSTRKDVNAGAPCDLNTAKGL